jgi:hypothetical protein
MIFIVKYADSTMARGPFLAKNEEKTDACCRPV